MQKFFHNVTLHNTVSIGNQEILKKLELMLIGYKSCIIGRSLDQIKMTAS